MTYEFVKMAAMVVKIFAAAVTGIFLGSLFSEGARRKMKRRYRDAKESYAQSHTSNPDKKFAYDELEAKLLSQGIKYRMGKDFSPFDYIVFRLACALGAGIFSMFFKIWFFPVTFFLVFVFIPIYFKQEDGNDNEAMLPDISNLNSLVALQMKNGVFLSKVIYECYRVVENKRLKDALLELALDMENFSNIRQAAERFRAKFTSPYLDTFAKTLEQAQDSGNSVEFFEDIQSDVASINEAIAIREEAKAERTAGIFQVMLFIGPVLIVFYILLGMMTGNGLF
ncbi:MAG: type II secretion system F family protein [Lachnospiraceae bacterium]|nr:type II secretion system F family protein [Lachnospiraceae bacterium]